jgi:TolB-like protein/DNA-binding winged helix-turn-helix (wHTH) protein/tetratricopeptide (TPR) repeat protein
VGSVVDGDFRLGSWLVRPGLNSVSRNGTSVQLEPKVMAVLVCLAAHAHEPVPKEKLLHEVWPDTFVGEGVLVRSIFELRRVFGDAAHESRIIETIPKRGYRLLVTVTPRNEQVPGQLATPQAIQTELPQARPSIRRWKIGLSAIGIIALVCGLLLAFNIAGSRERVFGNGGPPLIRSLAVLPLQNLSGDPSQEYFADGMTEELITELSGISALKVISRTSVMRYKNTNKSLPDIAGDLHVDGIVEGSVMRSGDSVRITAQLIYARTDTNIWARTYDRDLRDVLALQSAVATAIADEIQVRLTPQYKLRLANARAINPKALDAYLAGRYHLEQMSILFFKRGMERSAKDEQTKAMQSFREAIKHDPTYAPGYLGVADALVASYELSSDGVRDAKIAVAKALELDESLVEAHITLAMIREYDWDWAGAEKEYQQAVELNPSSALAHDEYGYFFDAMGRLDEAMAEHQKAQELDPIKDHIGGELYFRRKWDLGRDLIVEQGGANGGNTSDWYRAVEYERLGMYKEAVAEWEHVAKIYGYDDLAVAMARGYSKSGYKAALQEVVLAMEKYARRHYFAPWIIAHFYGELDDKDRAFAWLEKCYEQHDNNLQFLKVDPLWSDNLRSDPRFAELVRRVGLPQ